MASSLLELLGRLLTVRAVLAVSSTLLSLAGCYLVLVGVKDDGYLDFKTALLEGHLKSGAAGIFIILFAVIQSALLLRIRSSPNENDRTVEVSIGPDIKIVLTGVRSMRETVDKLTPIIREISSRQAEGTPGTVSASMHDSASGLNHPRSGVHSLHKP